MKFDLADLLLVFDLPLSTSDETRGLYDFECLRPNGIRIRLSFSAYESSASVILKMNSGEAVTAAYLDDCGSIRVLDPTRKIVEVLAGKNSDELVRLLIALQDDSILTITQQRE